MQRNDFSTDVAKPTRDAGLSRRRLLQLGAASLITGFFRDKAAASLPERSLAFFNTHTGERLRVTYWERGRYIGESLADINQILRDHRANEIAAIDTTLLDLLFTLRKNLDSQHPFHVISGYRSAQTNAALHTASSGVAQNSLHCVGKAIDIRLPGRELRALHKAAIALKAGGVGYYRKSDFVHVDVGRVRYW
jgi:uncharacterized protein YcbK (DUF882 family)